MFVRDGDTLLKSTLEMVPEIPYTTYLFHGVMGKALTLFEETDVHQSILG